MQTSIKIGFIGGGQLARMSAHEAIKLGHSCLFYSNDIDGPCKGLGEFFSGSDSNVNDYIPFAKACDVVTLENEYIDSSILVELEKHTKVFPSSYAFSLIEDKFKEKVFFRENDIPVADFALIEDLEKDIMAFVETRSFPVMFKSVKGGYDGFGNKVVADLEQAKQAYSDLGGNKGQEIIIEEMQDFKSEVAVTVARNERGDVKVYPVVDSIQSDAHVCVKVIAPSKENEKVKNLVNESALKAMNALRAVGVFSFEFFVLKDDSVVLNESAPRPHNSAHYTMDACVTSQFKNHILAITEEELGDASLKCKEAIMDNLLGVVEPPRDLGDNEFLHWYDKKEARPGRKMGHINRVYN
jgi:5-(carboxyamino)imidazole ribonucleotide synthase